VTTTTGWRLRKFSISHSARTVHSSPAAEPARRQHLISIGLQVGQILPAPHRPGGHQSEAADASRPSTDRSGLRASGSRRNRCRPKNRPACQAERDAAELAGCSHHTVGRYVAAREEGRLPGEAPTRRARVIDPSLAKLEELVDRSHGKVRADVAHEKITAMGYAGSKRTTRRAVAQMKAAYAAGRRHT
jgi:hypothetical protein